LGARLALPSLTCRTWGWEFTFMLLSIRSERGWWQTVILSECTGQGVINGQMFYTLFRHAGGHVRWPITSFGDAFVKGWYRYTIEKNASARLAGRRGRCE
jgi:hypothetical protein